MTTKDYYATLMVHPSAEPFLIDAAYKRLAREYHPDISSGPNSHERMVDLNEAYEVLSDPVRRKAYDEAYSRQTFGNQTEPHDGHKAESATNQTTESKARKASPVPPDPTHFGIASNYLERAIEGARAWHKRKHRFPTGDKWVVRIICIGGGIAISLASSWPRAEVKGIAIFAWVAFLLAEIPIRVIEGLHDSNLKRTLFNPRYNPNPSGYNQYAIELAKYESEIANVYVSRNWIYHSNKFCCGMSNYYTMPKWKAVAQNTRSCSHCGYFSISPKRLPPPFGNGSLPQYDSASSDPRDEQPVFLSSWGRLGIFLFILLLAISALLIWNRQMPSDTSKIASQPPTRTNQSSPRGVLSTQKLSSSSDPSSSASQPQLNNTEKQQNGNSRIENSEPAVLSPDNRQSSSGTPKSKPEQAIEVAELDADLRTPAPERQEKSLSSPSVAYARFTIGSTRADVLRTQGTPDSFTDSAFRYGTSYVYFRDDHVVSWDNGYPKLKAVIVPASIDTKGYFTIGSTRDEVLSAQGTPDSFAEYEFRYGTSRVSFSGGRVSKWDNGYPKLKVRYATTSTSQPRGYFTVGATRDEVVTEQGTPDEFTDYGFRYGTSRVLFLSGRVKGWDNGYPRLKAKLIPVGSVPITDYFTIGATKDDVLFIQGTPDEFSDIFFRYGTSRIYFVNGRVKNWDNGYPRLKTRL